jgi:glycosyltransferase involved in cell wall biosynthesis
MMAEATEPSMSRPPRVSIGLPVFNGERFIEEAISSILAQTFEDFELIISDNASTDSTQEICRRFADKDDRVRYLRNRENLGLAYNFNQTFHMSSGEYFQWAAHDDLLLPECLQRCVEALDGEPAAVSCYTSRTPIDEVGNPIDVQYPNWRVCSTDPVERFRSALLMFGRTQLPIFGLFRAEVLRRTGLHRTTLGGDCILMSEVSLYGPFLEVSEKLFIHRWHSEMSGGFSALRQRLDWWRPATQAGWLGRGRLGLPLLYVWTLTEVAAGLADAILRSPLSRQEKVRCLAGVPIGLGHYVWRRAELHLRRQPS